jgi:hypothetical protein
MAIKSYLFRADEKLFDTVEQIREKLSMGTTKDTLVFLLRSGVASVCMQHGIQIKDKEEIITVPPPTFKEEVFVVPEVVVPQVFKLVDEPVEAEEVTVEEG